MIFDDNTGHILLYIAIKHLMLVNFFVLIFCGIHYIKPYSKLETWRAKNMASNHSKDLTTLKELTVYICGRRCSAAFLCKMRLEKLTVM